MRCALLGLLVLAGSTACAREQRARCELAGEARVTLSAAASFDGIALAGREGSILSVWSEPSGTWARREGAKSTNTRLAERCAGGIAMTADGSWLGCVRPSADEESSEVVLMQLTSSLSVTRTVKLGAPGRDGRGIALAQHGRALYAAWEDGHVGAPCVRLSELPVSGEAVAEPAARSLSLPGSNGRQPALLSRGEHLYAVWSESDLVPGGESHRIMIARAGGKGHLLRAVQLANPAPTLAADAQGLVIAYRDKQRKDVRSELYVARLRDDLTLLDKPHKLGRANSEGGPSLALCGRARAAVMPIDHAGELYVAFHPLSAGLSVLEDNHQFYATDREFVLAGTLCTAEGLTALLAERTPPSTPGSELLKVNFRCAD